MTDNNNTLRAVFLAALMVLWVFAGTVAFAGGAAAVSEGDLEDTRVSVEDQSTGAQTDYTASTSFQNTNDPGSDNPSGVAAVELVFEDASEFGGNTGNFSGREDVNVTIEDPNAGQYGETETRTVPLQSASEDGDTITLDFQDKENVSDDARLTVQTENDSVQNPSVDGTYELEFRSYTDEGPSDNFESATVEYDIEGDGGDDDEDRNTDAEFDGQATRWKGQILDFQARPDQCNTDRDSYQLRYYTPDQTTPYGGLIREITLNSSDGAQIPTRNVADFERVVIVAENDSGNKRIVDVDDGEQTATCYSDNDASDDDNGQDDWVEVIPQDFSADFEEDTVRVNSNATLDLESNRNGYDVYIDSEDFTQSELASIIEGASTTGINERRAQSEDVVRVNDTSTSDELEFDFGGVDTGNYTFDLTPTDTIPEDNASIEVREQLDDQAEFDSETGGFTVKRGDIQSPEGDEDATISIDTQGDVDFVVLTIGEQVRNNYETQVTAEPDEDGNIDIRMNTFLAGQYNESNEDRAYEAENGSIVDVSRNSPKLTGVLDEGQYFVTLENTNGAELDSGVVNIRPSNYENLSQLRHPDAPLGAADEVDEVAGNEDFSTTSKIAMADRDRSSERDLLVHRVNISGIYGALDAIANSDLENADGNQVLADAQSEDPLGVADRPVLEVELNQTNFKQNREPKVEQYQNPEDTDQFRFVIDEDNETLYVVTDVRDLELEREVGNQSSPIETQVNVNNPPDGEGDNFSFDFDVGPGFENEYEGGIDTYVPEGGTDVFVNIEDREGEFDEQNEDTVRVNPESNQTISGETNVAPGTEVVVAVDSRGPVRRANQTETNDLSPVFARTTAEVDEDGNFSADTFDFSDNEVGRTFTVTAQNQGFRNNAAKPGIVVEGEPANVSLSDITVPSDEDELATITVDSAYLPQGGFVTIHDGTLADGAVLDSVRGTSEYLEEDTLHEDIEVELDDPYTEDGTAIAMPHQDNGNETYDFVTSNGTEDAPYTAGDEDNIVTATASVTFETETPTPGTETPTETPTGTPTGTASPTGEDQPGFGAVLALIALIGAALLAARRNDF